MKVFCRRGVTVVLAIALSFTFASGAFAGPRNGRDRDDPRVPDRVIRFIKKVQKIFHIVALEDLPVPPRP
jgi:hypothetical protein